MTKSLYRISGLLGLLSAMATAFVATVSPARAQAPVPPLISSVNPSYYHLRVKFFTTSDHSKLELIYNPGILSMRLTGINGNPKQVETNVQRLSINQDENAWRAEGGSAGVVVEYALAADKADRPLYFHLAKGARNNSWVLFYCVLADKEYMLYRFDAMGPRNTNVNFAFSPETLRSYRPQRKTIQPSAGVPKMVWAYYYTWWETSWWDRPTLIDHPTVRYSSDDPRAIERQIDEAKAAGIDGFVASWWGPGHKTDRNLKKLLEVAQAKDFMVSVYVETRDNHGARPEEEIANWLSYLISTYRGYPALMKLGGKPVIFLYASQKIRALTWKEIITRLRAQGSDAYFVGSGTEDLEQLSLMDGIADYSIFRTPLNEMGKLNRRASQTAHYFPLLTNGTRGKLYAPSVQPGVDVRALPKRDGSFVNRKNGDYYRRTWDAAIQANPDWVVVCTWNEWYENSQIEPGERYGDQYLRITREYANRFKANTGQQPLPVKPVDVQDSPP